MILIYSMKLIPISMCVCVSWGLSTSTWRCTPSGTYVSTRFDVHIYFTWSLSALSYISFFFGSDMENRESRKGQNSLLGLKSPVSTFWRSIYFSSWYGVRTYWSTYGRRGVPSSSIYSLSDPSSLSDPVPFHFTALYSLL